MKKKLNLISKTTNIRSPKKGRGKEIMMEELEKVFELMIQSFPIAKWYPEEISEIRELFAGNGFAEFVSRTTRMGKSDVNESKQMLAISI